MKKTYWSVKSGYGCTILFDNYEQAKKQSECDFCDKPVKHTVKEETYNELENAGAFYYYTVK